jgi:hypothetical protein
MSLPRSLSERNEHEKFEKSLDMPLPHLKTSPSIFAISRPPSELMVLSMHTVPRRKKDVLREDHF